MFDNTSSSKLTPKQRVFVQEYVDNRGNGTKAALKAYGTDDKPVAYSTAHSIASENLQKPSIVMALGRFNDMIESKIVRTIEDWGDSDKPREREIAVDLMKYSHDKIHGRASQSVNISSTHVNISLDLTGGAQGVIPQDVLDSLAQD